jgi:nitrogenase molybdenum-iron protein alpha chain
MIIDLNAPEAIIRERRLGSVLSYRGPASELCRMSRAGGLSCHDNTFNQCGDCSAQRAMLPISQIRDGAMVNHAPIGCAGDFSLFNSQFRRGLGYRGLPAANLRALSTNLTESDMVYGGADKLARTIRLANRRFSPGAIFITTSCASGIIGDDVEQVSQEAEAELGVPIVPVYCEGFKSRVWTTGFDACYHSILRKLVKPPKVKRRNLINIMGFTNEPAFTPFLAKLGLEANYLVHQSSVEELGRMSEAAASAHMCETLGTYLARGLEQEFGVPEVPSPPPYGLEWSDRWLRAVGQITDRLDLAEKVIIEERRRIGAKLDEIRKELSGLSVYAVAGASFGHSMLAICRDLGLKVLGMTGFHHDLRFDNDYEETNSLNNAVDLIGDMPHYHVCNKQPYQLVNILGQLKPDLLMGRHEGLPVAVVKMGIPTFFASDANLMIGYEGLVYTGRMIIRVLRSRNFARNLARHSKPPYTDWWLTQDPFMFRRSGDGF